MGCGVSINSRIFKTEWPISHRYFARGHRAQCRFDREHRAPKMLSQYLVEPYQFDDIFKTDRPGKNMSAGRLLFFKVEDIPADMVVVVIRKIMLGCGRVGYGNATLKQKRDLFLGACTWLGEGNFAHEKAPINRTTRPGAVPEGVPWRVLLLYNIIFIT